MILSCTAATTYNSIIIAISLFVPIHNQNIIVCCSVGGGWWFGWVTFVGDGRVQLKQV